MDKLRESSQNNSWKSNAMGQEQWENLFLTFWTDFLGIE